MKISKFLLLGLIAFIYSCGFTSVHPLANIQSAKFDSRLQGLWYTTSEDSKIFLHVGKSNDNSNLTKLIYIEYRNGTIKDYADFIMFPTVIGNSNYLSIQINFEKDDSENNLEYFFAKYEPLSPNKLRVYFISPEFIKKSIEKGKIEGEIPKEKRRHTEKGEVLIQKPLFATPKITDKSINIQMLLKEAEDKEIFEEPIILEKVHYKNGG